MKNIMQKRQAGLSLIEMMIALAIALFLMAVALGVYFQEANLYKTTGTQASIQSAENAISAIVAPAIRSAGFMGCSALSNANGETNQLVTGGSPPLGKILSPGSSLDINQPRPASVWGYDALYSAAPSPITITENAANDGTATHWVPALDATLAGMSEQGSDVLVVLGPVPGSQPATVLAINANNMVLPAGLAAATFNSFAPNAGTWVALSNCNVSTILKVTLADPALNYPSGGGAISDNTVGITATNFVGQAPPISGSVGSGGSFYQIVPLQQTAFFVAKGTNGQSALWTAVLGGANNNTWVNATPLIPGVDNMQILYGVSATASSTVQQYLRADQVNTANAWGLVHSVRMGFLLDGQLGSATSSTATATVLDATVNLNAPDTRLRHVFETTVDLRNAL